MTMLDCCPRHSSRLAPTPQRASYIGHHCTCLHVYLPQVVQVSFVNLNLLNFLNNALPILTAILMQRNFVGEHMIV